MRNVTMENVTDVVIESLGKHEKISARQREIMESLIRHLHGFCKDVKLTHDEFLYACDYLGRAGALCSANQCAGASIQGTPNAAGSQRQLQ